MNADKRLPTLTYILLDSFVSKRAVCERRQTKRHQNKSYKGVTEYRVGRAPEKNMSKFALEYTHAEYWVSLTIHGLIAIMTKVSFFYSYVTYSVCSTCVD
jgi:hypothetical protein